MVVATEEKAARNKTTAIALSRITRLNLGEKASVLGFGEFLENINDSQQSSANLSMSDS
jgi:hypothetical protein